MRTVNERSQHQHHSARGLDVLRVSMVAVTGIVGVAWVSSYFVGLERYRSAWFSSKSTRSEEARWWVSNFGSFGYAWRSQEGPSGPSVPADQFKFKTFPASPSALDNVHPDGFLAWHWVHFERLPRTIGPTKTEYGHFYIPYWMPFLVCGLLAAICFRREE